MPGASAASVPTRTAPSRRPPGEGRPADTATSLSRPEVDFHDPGGAEPASGPVLSSRPMAAPQRLVLIDGSALIFRAYFAIPSHFTTGDGLHTNAIYGFTTMFRKLLSGRTPDYGAVIFDAPGPTFRDDRYPAYKAQRPRMDDDLAEQLPWIDEVVAAHRFPSFRVPGFEADDVIGTLARVATERGLEVLIVSGDKDFAQLVDERVRMLDPIRDVTYDAELVRKKWGVPSRQFVDLLALMGDKVDNIPGVPGIGQKGAAGLLEAWGDLDAILANTGALKGRQKATLEENAERARLSRELATIDVNVPLEIELDALRYAPPNPSELNALYRRLEFWSLLSEEAKDERATAEQDAEAYELVADEAALTARLAGCGVDGPAALHAVFDGPYATRGAWVGLAVAPAPGRAFYLPLGAERPAPAALAAWLADPSRAKVAHEARRLIVVLERHGLELQGLVGDPQLASFLLDPQGLIPHRKRLATWLATTRIWRWPPGSPSSPSSTRPASGPSSWSATCPCPTWWRGWSGPASWSTPKTSPPSAPPCASPSPSTRPVSTPSPAAASTSPRPSSSASSCSTSSACRWSRRPRPATRPTPRCSSASHPSTRSLGSCWSTASSPS